MDTAEGEAGEVEVMFTFPFSRCITALLSLTYLSGHTSFHKSSVFVILVTVTVCFFFHVAIK